MRLGSHGWWVPVHRADPAALQATFEAAVRAWWPHRAGQVRLWHEPVPAASGTPTAEWCRDRELQRPAGGHAPLRAVLLTYLDGDADLVVVADRGALDAESLRIVSDVTLGRSSPGAHPVAAGSLAGGGEPAAHRRPEPAGGDRLFAWGTPDPVGEDRVGVVRLPLTGASPDVAATLAAATSVVLESYGDSSGTGVPVVTAAPDRPVGTLGCWDQRPPGLADARAVVVADDHGAPYLPCQGAPFPLTLVPRRRGNGVHVEVRHRLRELDGDSARRFAEHVAAVHAQLTVGTPTDAVEVPGPTGDTEEAAGRHPAAAPGAARIEDVLAARARERPDAVAVTDRTSTLTYRELTDRAAGLARTLRHRGVREGDRVGVCLDRGPDLVVAMLATLMAGAAYVPLDPHYPDARLAYTVADATLRMIVTERVLPGDVVVATVGPAERDAGAPELPAARGGAAGAAYVIYTSGSTGRPKGVVVPHGNVTALIDATRDDFGLGPRDVWTFFHSSAFDFSVWEIWGCLLTGGRLVVVPYWTSRSPEDFLALLADRRVTVLSQTPSAFAQLIAADQARRPDLELRLIVFGGEPLDPRMLLRWFDRHPESRCRLVNMFGITETTVHVTAGTVRRADALTGSRSVGRALPGWRVSVRDTRGRAVPVGVPGEICVAGAGVAAGYLDRPELTAERFVPGPGERMYRSGDLGRMLADGRLEHLGRIDSQVKVRGFRIELDEIRGVLLEDPAVTAAAVVLGGRGGDASQVRLDAYVTPAGADTGEIRRRAASMLPDYMVPATVTALPALPLTVNGKLDTARLPPPDVPRTAQTGPRPPAPDGLSAALASVWEEVLGVSVAPADNFFDLGGNSLSAVRIAALMRDRGMPRLPLRELYRNPTVGALAKMLAVSGQ